VDHQELILAAFGGQYPKGNSLEIIPHEDNSLFDTWARGRPVMLDDLKAAVLDDVQRALAGDPVLGS
jgi:hypothetical protein